MNDHNKDYPVIIQNKLGVNGLIIREKLLEVPWNDRCDYFGGKKGTVEDLLNI